MAACVANSATITLSLAGWRRIPFQAIRGSWTPRTESGNAERRVTQIDDELATLEGDLIDEREVAAALADFDALWECLVPREQARVIELLVERVAYDGQGGNVAITFRPSGIKALAGELAARKEEAA